jgi:hypothetical protein
MLYSCTPILAKKGLLSKGVAFLAVYKKRMPPELRGGVSVCLHESLDQLFKLGPGVGVSACAQEIFLHLYAVPYFKQCKNRLAVFRSPARDVTYQTLPGWE